MFKLIPIVWVKSVETLLFVGVTINVEPNPDVPTYSTCAGPKYDDLCTCELCIKNLTVHCIHNNKELLNIAHRVGGVICILF